VIPEVNPEIWALRPDFVALSVVVTGGRNGLGQDLAAGEVARPAWAEDHLAAWRDAYKAFGSKPQRTPCSAEALWRRLERDGALTAINAVVDLYNAVSLRYAVPVGGEDLAAYQGVPRLVRARGDEVFQATREGQPIDEIVDRGEVVWRDDVGVTCRRWNWRQTARTRITAASTDMWFIIERLEPMPLEALSAAGDELTAGLLRLQPDAKVTATLIKRDEQPTANSELRTANCEQRRANSEERTAKSEQRRA
jgi:DNA/RNA-binding domain of Phe-tRNA-synthetase-like protein